MAVWNRFVRAITEAHNPYPGLATGDKLCTWCIGLMTLEPDDVWNRIRHPTEKREPVMATYRQQMDGMHNSNR